MNIQVTTKSGIQPSEVVFPITQDRVLQHLQEQLGFALADCDFTRWTGISTDDSYVRMRCVFNADDIMAKTTAVDYVDRVLAANASGIMFQDHVIETLKPYMYPATIRNVVKNPEALQRLFALGITGPNLEEIIRFSQLTYDSTRKVFAVYLRPERIIEDMLRDMPENKVGGKLVITNVFGTTNGTIRWKVSILINGNQSIDPSELDINQIFQTT